MAAPRDVDEGELQAALAESTRGDGREFPGALVARLARFSVSEKARADRAEFYLWMALQAGEGALPEALYSAIGAALRAECACAETSSRNCAIHGNPWERELSLFLDEEESRWPLYRCPACGSYAKVENEMPYADGSHSFAPHGPDGSPCGNREPFFPFTPPSA